MHAGRDFPADTSTIYAVVLALLDHDTVVLAAKSEGDGHGNMFLDGHPQRAVKELLETLNDVLKSCF